MEEPPYQHALENGDVAGMRAWLGESFNRYQDALGEGMLQPVVVRTRSAELSSQDAADGLGGDGGRVTPNDSIERTLIR